VTVQSSVGSGPKSRITWYAWPKRRARNLYQVVPLVSTDAVQVTGVPTLVGAGADGASESVIADVSPDRKTVIKAVGRHTRKVLIR
jgi:hypothetical protein